MARAENQVRFIVVMGSVDHGKNSLLSALLHRAVEQLQVHIKVENVFPEGICFLGGELKDNSTRAIPDAIEAKAPMLDLFFCADEMHRRLEDLIARHCESIKQRFCDVQEKRQSESLWACNRTDTELSCSNGSKLNKSEVMEMNHDDILMQNFFADLGLSYCECPEQLVQSENLELWMKELCDGLIMSIGKEFADMICHLLNQRSGLLKELFSDRRLLLILQNDWKKIMLESRNSEKRFADWYREGPPNNYEICHTLSTAA